MSERPARFGLVLPHFGAEPQLAQLLAAARLAEESGFDSLWVRDRLVAGAPHGLLLEAGGTTFFEPLLTLAAVAAITNRIELGTAVLLPNRHPLKLVQEVGTLQQLAPGRITIGLGLGVGSANFESLGFEYESRRELFEEIVQVLRRSPQDGHLEHSGRHFSFGPVEIDPAPRPPVRIYYGGVSRAAVRRAFEHCDGWIAGRLPRDTFRARMELVERYRAEQGRDIDVASMPITLVDDGLGGHMESAEEAVGLLAQSAEGAKDWIKPPSGSFENVDDLAGLLIIGDPERCSHQVSEVVGSGVSHVIFDLRLVFTDIEQQIAMLAEEVLPRVKADSANP